MQNPAVCGRFERKMHIIVRHFVKNADFISVYPFSCKKSFRFVTAAFRIVTD